MHILGKVLLWLCVILLIPASLVLTTMTLDVRHRWLQDVADRQQRVEQGIQQIADVQRRVRTLEEKRQVLVSSWGDVWNAPNSGPQAGTPGAVELQVGASSGLPQRGPEYQVDPAVYVFAETADGSQYLGAFLIADIRPTQAIARLVRAPYPQEIESWPRGTYHVRNNLPANWLTTAATLQGQQDTADAMLVDQQLVLSTRKEMVKVSQATLDQRLAELNGNPQASPEAEDEVKDGLVESLRKFENARNQLLVDVDGLRHRLFAEYSELEQTLLKNVEKDGVLNEKYGNPEQSPPASIRRETSVQRPILPKTR